MKTIQPFSMPNTCKVCGMLAPDPSFHKARYGHTPVLGTATVDARKVHTELTEHWHNEYNREQE